MTRAFRALAVAAVVVLSAAVASAQQGRIAGVIRDEQGEPVRGGTVTAEFLDAAVSPITSVADEKGRWAMVGLRGGTWMFTARAPGYFGSGEEMNIRVANQNP